jgi:tetratricopeptide (TPR) repeat protein
MSMIRKFLGAASLAMLLAFSLHVRAVGAADQPNVSGDFATDFTEANDDVKAKKWTEAIAKVKAIQANPKPKSPYDNYVANALLMSAYSGLNDQANAEGPIEVVAASEYYPAAQKATLYKLLASINFGSKNYDKAIEFTNKAIALGDTSEDTTQSLASAYYLTNRYKEALAVWQEIASKAEAAGKKPDEKTLKLIWQTASNLKDESTQAKVIDKLVADYPKPEYWQNAMVSLRTSDVHDDRLLLNIYRLKNEVGVLTAGDEYSEMAQIALDQGNPGLAQSAMETAIGKKVFTDPRDQDRAQRLLDLAKKQAATDRSALAKDEADAANAPSGEVLVNVGATYLGFGMNDKAVAAISAGIAKGNLKRPNEDYLLLGIAEARMKNNAEAAKAFGKVSGDTRYVRLAKLWGLATHTAS